mmetsp:Transcript_74029/g.190989  ORF Transcript_74029/g.190989 Transcript_74029/m.190989 type:complete len:219 (+) Transcript_74029:768-1424(+)
MLGDIHDGSLGALAVTLFAFPLALLLTLLQPPLLLQSALLRHPQRLWPLQVVTRAALEEPLHRLLRGRPLRPTSAATQHGRRAAAQHADRARGLARGARLHRWSLRCFGQGGCYGQRGTHRLRPHRCFSCHSSLCCSIVRNGCRRSRCCCSGCSFICSGCCRSGCCCSGCHRSECCCIGCSFTQSRCCRGGCCCNGCSFIRSRCRRSGGCCYSGCRCN